MPSTSPAPPPRSSSACSTRASCPASRSPRRTSTGSPRVDDEIHAFLHTHPEATLARAAQLDEHGPQRAAGRADRPQGPVHARRASRPRPARASSRATARRTPAPSCERCGRGRPGQRRQDQHGRVRDGLLHRELGLRPDAQPLGHDARAGRLERRLLGRGGRRAWRRSSLGTDTGGSIRQPAALCGDRRAEADLRRGLALRRRGLRLVARPGRAVRPQRCATRRCCSTVIAGAGPLRLDLRRPARAGRAARARGPARPARGAT